MIIEKEIKFNNERWLVRLTENYKIEAIKFREDGHLALGCVWKGYYTGSLKESFQNAVLQANHIEFKAKDIEELNEWDGDMDRELNPKTLKQLIDEVDLK